MSGNNFPKYTIITSNHMYLVFSQVELLMMPA
jgi:hypothetical protein